MTLSMSRKNDRNLDFLSFLHFGIKTFEFRVISVPVHLIFIFSTILSDFDVPCVNSEFASSAIVKLYFTIISSTLILSHRPKYEIYLLDRCEMIEFRKCLIE